jgi:hypothetical protein
LDSTTSKSALSNSKLQNELEELACKAHTININALNVHSQQRSSGDNALCGFDAALMLHLFGSSDSSLSILSNFHDKKEFYNLP